MDLRNAATHDDVWGEVDALLAELETRIREARARAKAERERSTKNGDQDP